MTAKAPIIPRVLAVLAATCLVGAFSLAVFYPPMLTLNHLISQYDHQMLMAAQDWVRDHWGEAIWRTAFLPLLVRPAWLLPLTLALVFTGLALTVRSAHRVPGSPRWRN